ncbi:hypothetical protein SLE2022_321350 [Rubroshorea leprosula]
MNSAGDKGLGLQIGPQGSNVFKAHVGEPSRNDSNVVGELESAQRKELEKHKESGDRQHWKTEKERRWCDLEDVYHSEASDARWVTGKNRGVRRKLQMEKRM